MPGPSAREMLSKLPLRMANGGPINLSTESAYDQSAAYKRALESGGEEGVQAYYANLRDLAGKYMAGEGQFAGNQPIGVEAYNIMLESGISNTDLINAGVGQDVLDKIFTTPATGPRVDLPTTVESAFVTNPVLAAEAAARTARGDPGVESLQRQAREYLARVQQGGITPAEQSLLRELALEGGYTIADIQAAGIDPGILFNIPKPKEETVFRQTQDTYTAPTVYTSEGFGTDPGIYGPGEPALDEAFTASDSRTEVTEDIFGEQQLTGFNYLPAAQLLSATGSGFSFTPPSVTSRPRTLMSTDKLGRYTRGRAAQDLQQLLGPNRAIQFPDASGQMQDTTLYDRYKPLLERTGSYGGGLSRSQLYALMRQEQAREAREARAAADAGAGAFTPSQSGTIADYIALNPDVVEDFNTQIDEGRMSSDMTLEQFATNHYNTFGMKEMASGMRAPFTLTGGYAGATGALQPRDLRDPTMGTRFMAEGGAVKKPKGYADGGSVPAFDSGDLSAEDLQRQLEALDQRVVEEEVRAAAQAPSDTDQETRTESRGMLDRLNQSFFENVTQPVIGSALDMTVGLGDLAQLGVKKGAEALGIETKPFVPVSQRLQESAGVAGYDPYSPAAIATQILPFARAKQGATVAATELGRLFPSLGRETVAYGGSEIAAAGARELMPDSTAAELLASVVGGAGGYSGADVGSTAMRQGIVDQNAKGHALPPELLVEGTGQKAETPVVQSFTPKNKDAVIANIDATIARHPDALTSEQSWKDTEAEAFGGDYLPAPPSQAVKYNNDPALLAAKLDKLTPELKASVDEGFGYVNQIRNMYNSQMATPEMTGRLFMWGILSRGAGPVQQEAAFIDLLDKAQPFIAKSARGDFTESDLSAWKEMVKVSLPKGSPSNQVTMNANSAGKLLYALSQTAEGTNAPALRLLHNSLANPKVSGPEFRRQFFRLTNKPGIDNKVVSFIGLVGGKDDMLVMDRIQSRHLWDDGRYEGKNIYDGINKSGLSKILVGPRGLMLTEMLENGMGDAVSQAYKMIGRPQDGSIGRMHWETWLIEGNQGVSHSTLQAVRSGTPIGGGVTEGKPGTFSSGMTYRQALEGPIVEYPLSDGSIVRMTPERQKEFEAFVKKPSNGIIPTGFKVTESITGPWYTRPEVDRRKLDEAAKQFENANPDGSLRSGDVRDIQGRGALSERRGDFLTAFRRDAANVARSTRGVSGGPDGRNLSQEAGPYTRGTVGTDGRDGLLTFSPDQNALTQYQSASLSLPVIRQVDSAANAAAYNADMTQAMASNSMAAQVDIKSPEELADARLFRTESGSGFAIKPDGDIVAVFASANEPRRGSYAMLQAAVQAGGKKLDAFDTYLPDIYERVGFRPVARLPWNDEFAPDNWDKNTFKKHNNGEPDIVFFVHDPDYFGGAKDVPVVKEYADAVALQDKAIEQTQVSSILEDQRKAWREANKGDFRQAQTPELEEAARDLQANKISIEDYAQKVKELRPIELITEVPKISSFEEIAYALDQNKVDKGLIGLNKEIADGTMVGSRLDIPAYNQFDTWVVSLHEGAGVSGPSIGYGKVAVLDDVKFNSNPDSALKVASGKSDKAPFARMNGKWRNMEVEEVQALAEKYLNDPEWTQVGMNPYRHSFFYDKNTGMPVASADQVIQIGPLVLAKNTTTRPLRSPEHMLKKSDPDNPQYFNRGGDVDRKDDNRTYI